MAARFGTLTLLVAAALMVVLVTATPSCDDKASADVAAVKIGGRTFHLELALNDAVRFKGLSGRTFIEPDGGMLFIFPYAVNTGFVMRDCPIPIDIIFLDASGRITAMHKMKPEPPRGPDEVALDPETRVNQKYEDRLPRYPTRFSALYAIELAGNTLDSLNLREGDRIAIDPSLKSRVK